MYRVVAACFVSLGIALSLSHPVDAIEASGIGILPAHPRSDAPRSSSIIIHTASAGATLSDGVTVANNSERPVTLAVYVTDSQVSSDGAFACAQQIEVPQKVGRWVALDTSSITLQPGKSETVAMSISMPQHIEAGEYNGCVVVQEVHAQAPATQNGIALQFRSAMRVALTVPGDLRASLAIVDVVPKVFRETVQLKTTVKNTGSVSTDALFWARFDTIFGIVGPSREMGVYTVFPAVDSVFNFEATSPFWGGWYHVVVEATYREPLSTGKLSDKETTRASRSQIIFVMPQPLALFIEAVLLAGVIYGVAAGMRARHTRQLDREFGGSYTVQDGDTIETIARMHHISWRRLAARNRLKAPYTVSPGVILQLPYRAESSTVNKE